MKPLRQFTRNPYFMIVIALFLVHIFFMFYKLESWTTFGWDQVDNAWAAMRILTVHKYPLLGMVAKGNSGMYIGPLYYYFVGIFYFFTQLHPIASPLIAGCTALFSFWVIYYVTRRIFNARVALASCFIYTFSSFIIRSERIQWPVNFIAPLSLLIFYFLYKVLTGETKYAIHLAAAIGLSFHIHFTSIFYPIIVLLAIPFISLRKFSWKYILLSVPAFLVFFIPQAVYYVQAKAAGNISNYSGYFQTYYHGFHLRRLIQIAHDAFIEFEAVLSTPYKILRNAVFLYLPLFFLTSYSKPLKNWYKLCYITALWILVPWIIFATYSGELSDYYFSSHLYIAIIVFGYLTIWIWERKHLAIRVCLCIFWMYYAIANIQGFFNMPNGNLQRNITVVQQTIQGGRSINFTEGDPQSYLFYYYLFISHKPLPYQM